MRFLTVLRVLAYCCVAVPAGAQVTFANIRTNALPTVFVVDRAGQETTGQLVGLTDSALIVKTATALQTFQASEISLLERKGDSLKNGTLIGLAAGAVTAGLMTRSCLRAHCGTWAIPYVVINAGLITAIGAAIDAAIPGRTRLWPHGQRRTP